MTRNSRSSPNGKPQTSRRRPHPAAPGPLRGLDLDAMIAFVQAAGYPAYRARQIFQWIYEKGARSFDEMTNLPRPLREWLDRHTVLGGMARFEVVGPPGETQKIVFHAHDGEIVESVLMRGEFEPDARPRAPGANGAARPRGDVSLCLSSQVGCPLACTFCMTGHAGFHRDLDTDEIIDQVLTARRLIAHDERISNLVFMGMGEPMLNLRAVLPAIALLISPQGMRVPTRRITVSTAGIVPGIEALARAQIGVDLAVSLNATAQETRDRLMPGCSRWPLSLLLDACRRFPLTRRRRITFEYVLLKDVNDTDDDVRRLGRLLRRMRCKINLILYNPADCLDHEPTAEPRAEAIRTALTEGGYATSLRRSKGRACQAACGQLAAHAHAGRAASRITEKD